eukprot:COSAG05_NODE_612_length_8357_cov_40.832647_11_plen_219_part_00
MWRGKGRRRTCAVDAVVAVGIELPHHLRRRPTSSGQARLTFRMHVRQIQANIVRNRVGGYGQSQSKLSRRRHALRRFESVSGWVGGVTASVSSFVFIRLTHLRHAQSPHITPHGRNLRAIANACIFPPACSNWRNLSILGAPEMIYIRGHPGKKRGDGMGGQGDALHCTELRRVQCDRAVGGGRGVLLRLCEGVGSLHDQLHLRMMTHSLANRVAITI